MVLALAGDSTTTSALPGLGGLVGLIGPSSKVLSASPPSLALAPLARLFVTLAFATVLVALVGFWAAASLAAGFAAAALGAGTVLAGLAALAGFSAAFFGSFAWTFVSALASDFPD